MNVSADSQRSSFIQVLICEVLDVGCKKLRLCRKFKYAEQRLSTKVSLMGYEIDFPSAEKIGCSFRLVVADRVIIYVKNFGSKPTKFFAGEKDGTVNKEITRAELDTWLNILADNEAEVSEIQGKLNLGKKY